MRPEIDGRLAERLREIALLEEDSHILSGKLGASAMPECEVVLSKDAKREILNSAADLLEEYIMAEQARRPK